jgi:hypothetical protein
MEHKESRSIRRAGHGPPPRYALNLSINLDDSRYLVIDGVVV